MSTLPTGTVTFLFTDIAGSTRLWEEHGETMRDALARHDALLRAAIGAHGGHVFKAVGDALYAVFDVPLQAVMAALAGQRALAREAWAVPGGLLVRMALHTGTAQERDGDYFGPALNRVARLLAAGHGGQVLLSDATRAIVEQELPADVRLRDHGVHRLQDLAVPEHIYQAVVADLPAEFPPLRTLDNLPNNLPRQLTSFIGREREIAEVTDLVGTSPLATLLGPGGAGKTRLALQVAAQMFRGFKDGAWLVELADLRDPGLVPQAVAGALGIIEEVRRPVMATLKDYLERKALLLILDNCEHLPAACAALVHELLGRASGLRILATSQEALGIVGEVLYRMPPLSLPEVVPSPAREDIERFEAVRLFVDRALLSQPRFVLTDTNAPVVLQICRRLDGLPLAIELAAARLRVLSVEQIAARLDDRFRLLTSGDRGGLPRHQTLRAALDWSYDLLAAEERVLLRRLAVFAGGFTLEAAEVVCAAGQAETPNVLDGLTRLVEKSLVLFDQDVGLGRYRLLETIRLYAQDRLGESGEENETRRRHRDWCLALAEGAEPELEGRNQQEWLDRLDAEHDNLRAALAWSQASGDPADLEAALRLAGSLARFWEVRGYWREGRDRLEELVAGASPANAAACAKAINGAAHLAFYQGDYDHAVELTEQSLALSQQVGDKRAVASCLNILGFNACRLERFDRAAQFGGESLALGRELGDTRAIAEALAVLGLVARGAGDHERARAHLEESLAMARSLGHKVMTGLVLTNLGLVATEQGDYARAREVQEEVLRDFQALGDKYGIGFALSNLAIVAWHQQDYTRAQSLFRESLVIRQELGEKRGVAISLVGLGAVAVVQDRPEDGVLLFGAAEALRETLGVPGPPFIRGSYDGLVDRARRVLGESRFAARWQEGRSLSLEEAVPYALRAGPGGPSA